MENVQADYVGLAHYRRHSAGKRDKNKWKRIADEQDIRTLLTSMDVILPHKRNYYFKTTYNQYAHAHHAINLDTTRTILEVKFPDFLQAFDDCIKQTDGHKFNMFIIKKNIADAYRKWLFQRAV